MSIPFYADVHVPQPVIAGARARGVDVLTVPEDGRRREDDDVLLLRATALGRVMLSEDEDLLAHAARFMSAGIDFAGLTYAHQLGITIGRFVADLELLCLAEEPGYMRNRIEWLPLKH